MKKHISSEVSLLFLFLALFVSSSLHSQSPQGIPYQAVMRNADGSVMASSAVNLTFIIHDGTANGVVVYQESHSLTSNAQGLVSCMVGNGVVSQGNFSNINWGNGAKFLQVMMGSVDLGTQQMLSVPYALHAGSTHVSVSPTGDTLMVGGQSVIVPGLSSVNSNDNYNRVFYYFHGGGGNSFPACPDLTAVNAIYMLPLSTSPFYFASTDLSEAMTAVIDDPLNKFKFDVLSFSLDVGVSLFTAYQQGVQLQYPQGYLNSNGQPTPDYYYLAVPQNIGPYNVYYNTDLTIYSLLKPTDSPFSVQAVSKRSFVYSDKQYILYRLPNQSSSYSVNYEFSP